MRWGRAEVGEKTPLALKELQAGPLLSSVQKTQGAGEQLCAQATGSWTVSLKQDQVLTSSLRQAG